MRTAAVFTVLLLSGTLEAQPLERERAEHLFAVRVLPLFRVKCFACHGEKGKIRGGLDMRSREGLLRGGDSEEPSVVPDHPEKSRLIEAVERRDLKMPPKENDKLTAGQIEDLRRWVEAGAPWPGAKRIAVLEKKKWDESDESGTTVVTSGGLSKQWTNRRYQPEDLWAYQPMRKPTVPRGAAHPIDAFLERQLDAVGIVPAGRADKGTLIRRVYFDLIGLPPSPEEVAAFEKDDSPKAFEKVVDRLLASKHYGEQAAKHWLDVVRYADSAGFSNDFDRPHAWRYRDYVIRSFNDDKPFDEFVVEQLAGDELDPKNGENLIAVGFLRMGPWEHTAMSVAAVTRQQYLDDITNAVGVTFLGMGMSCCRCHDHKFDPLPTRDYYRMQAVFAPLQFADRNVPFLREENEQGLEAYAERVARLKGENRLKLILSDGATKEDLAEAKLGLNKVNRKRKQALDRMGQFPKPLALSVYNGPPNNFVSNKLYHPMLKNKRGKVQEVHILAGGALESPGEKVDPGPLSVVNGLAKWNSPKIPASMEGRRLALARWIAHPKNPLTARVIVNRIWQQHFGKGLVKTPNNFGKMGAKPSHPQLLDWLATWFVENGWSIKKLHKLIVTSESYQRAGTPPKRALEKDPANNLLSWFSPRRLTAEEIRDSQLSVSGALITDIGGLPIRPEINLEIAFQPRHVMGSVAPVYQPSPTRKERHRRTIYAQKIRTLRDPMLEVFDQPSPDLSCERRSSSTITPQVFSLFNGQQSHDRALAFALRVERETKTRPGRIRRAFELAYGRKPTEREFVLASTHVEKMLDHHRKNEPVLVPLPKVVRRELIEEMTGKKVVWDELLDVYEKYEPDTKPWQVGPETRALSELCLVLFNSNEFLYVD